MYIYVFIYTDIDIKAQIVSIKGRTEDRKDKIWMSRTEEVKLNVSSL